MSDSRDPHRDLAGVLHDVSNALTVLLGWVEEARSPAAEPAAVGYALSIIEQRARVARDLARHAIGGPRVDEQRDLASIIGEVVTALAVEATRGGTRIALTASDRRAHVSGAQDLTQVLTNLVLNALAYAPRGSTVHVATDIDDEAIAVHVSDEGPGVQPERRESIFAGDTTRPGGTGTGLRHSRALARAWGGDVVLLVDADRASGARFRITWPRADVLPRPPVSTARIPDLSGVRVLVIEDDVAVTQLLEAGLGARGADVTIIESAADLVASRGRSTWDAVLVDLSPFGGDAARAVAAVRAEAPSASIVLITGSADVVSAGETPAFVELVRKPFEVREVVAALLRRTRSNVLDEKEKPE